MDPNKNGTAILLKHGLNHSLILIDPDGRLVSIDLQSFTFINIYAPSGQNEKEERNNFLRRTVPAYALTFRLPLVLVGDLNCVDDVIQDRSQTKSNSRPSQIISIA
jgi:exonuclease III